MVSAAPGPTPLTKKRSVGADHPIRGISNFAGMRLTKELTDWILMDAVKFRWVIPLLNYTVI